MKQPERTGFFTARRPPKRRAQTQARFSARSCDPHHTTNIVTTGSSVCFPGSLTSAAQRGETKGRPGPRWYFFGGSLYPIKEKALDWLGGIETFQWVAPNLSAKNSFSAFSPKLPEAFYWRLGQHTTTSDFRKGKSTKFWILSGGALSVQDSGS
jgi:hypothetical protein